MAVYNTTSDSANTAVRAFLTKVGEYYLGHGFNTASGKGKKLWLTIRDEDFDGQCAYCGTSDEKLQIEHVLMFNRSEFGLHHPGNTVPCCKACNKRERDENKQFCGWEAHLKQVCVRTSQLHMFEQRKQQILAHFERYQYPKLTVNEQHAIRVIANSLYENTKLEANKSLELYKQLDEAFVENLEVLNAESNKGED